MKSLKWGAPMLAITLGACGGDSSSSSVALPASKSDTGVFSDSPVAGIHYKTASRSGYTNALGEYRFKPGETVTFSIGGTSLPPVPATGRVTPADMAIEGQPDTVTNILRLLQTLDDDNDPDNGITISAATHATLIGTSLDVSGASGDFVTQAETALGETLVSAVDAEAHFEASQQTDLRGSWLFIEPPGDSSNGQGPSGEEVNVLTFLDGGRYIVVHQYGNDDQGAATAEWGTYTWDAASGELVTSVQGESDGDGGLGNGTHNLTLVGESLQLGVDEAAVYFTRVYDAQQTRVGGWMMDDGSDFHVLTILDNNRYVVAHSNNDLAYGVNAVVPVSSEWGKYSVSGGNFAVTAITSETDGPAGLYDAENVGNEGLTAALNVARYGDLSFEPDSEDAFAMRRIGRFAVHLSDLDDNQSTVFVERTGGVFTAGQAKAFAFDMIGEGTVSHVSLQAGGAGSVTFAVGTADEEASDIVGSWSAYPGTGRLAFKETMGDGTTGSWVFAPVRTRDGSEKALVDFQHLVGSTQNDVGFFISPLTPLP